METLSGNQLKRQQDTSEPPYVVQKSSCIKSVKLAFQFPCETTDKIVQAWLDATPGIQFPKC